MLQGLLLELAAAHGAPRQRGDGPCCWPKRVQKRESGPRSNHFLQLGTAEDVVGAVGMV